MSSSNNNHKPSKLKFSWLVIAALGIVFGDIGTSPLYAVNEIFFSRGGVATTTSNVYGCIGLIFWTLTLIIAVKYIALVLRADSDGAGGVFALVSLIENNKTKAVAIFSSLAALAAGLLLGEGIITPAISVLSAVEGLKVATSAFEPFVIPITIIVLTALFAIQHKGTAKVGAFFGPIIAVWFTAIGLLGLWHIAKQQTILNAINPWYAFQFLLHHNLHQVLIVLGSVVLTITGGEALFADLGHFGRSPIRVSWFSLVYPALVFNYLGQGAYLLGQAAVKDHNLFYSTVPSLLVYPMVILATAATVIASQALISGAFSLASQAVALGLLPRLKIRHTHKDHEGQIYIRSVNWLIYLGCILLVLSFRSSTNLAAAYGLAVSGVMCFTSFGMFLIATKIWGWRPLKVIAILGPLALIDLSFLAANSLKLFEGGFVPLGIGLIVFILMRTWDWGRQQITQGINKYPTMSMADFVHLKDSSAIQLPKSIVVMSPEPISSGQDKLPPLAQVLWEREGLIAKHIVFLYVHMTRKPYIRTGRYQIKSFYEDIEKGSVAFVTINFGFMENPNVEGLLENLAKNRLIHLDEHPKNWIIHIVRERIFRQAGETLFERLRLRLFWLMLRNSTTTDEYFGLGKNVGLSSQILPVQIK